MAEHAGLGHRHHDLRRARAGTRWSTTLAGAAELDTTVIQRDTDIRFLRHLAQRNGFDVYVRPGPAPGVVEGHFHPPPVDEPPQGVLSVNLGEMTNVRSFSARHEMLRPAAAAVAGVEASTVETAGRGGRHADADRAGATALLGRTPPRTTQLKRTGLAKGGDLQTLAQAAVDRSTWAVTVEGELDTASTATRFASGGPCWSGGPAPAYSGTYFVERVRHRIEGERYTQHLTLRRNAVTPPGPSSSRFGLPTLPRAEGSGTCRRHRSNSRVPGSTASTAAWCRQRRPALAGPRPGRRAGRARRRHQRLGAALPALYRGRLRAPPVPPAGSGRLGRVRGRRPRLPDLDRRLVGRRAGPGRGDRQAGATRAEDAPQRAGADGGARRRRPDHRRQRRRTAPTCWGSVSAGRGPGPGVGQGGRRGAADRAGRGRLPSGGVRRQAAPVPQPGRLAVQHPPPRRPDGRRRPAGDPGPAGDAVPPPLPACCRRPSSAARSRPRRD